MGLFEKNFKIYDNNTTIVGFNSEMKAAYCNFYYKNTSDNIMIVTKTLYEANKICQYLSNYQDNVLLFPVDDFFFNDVLASSPELKVKRVETMIQIINNKRNVIVTNIAGYLKRVPTRAFFQNNTLELKTNSVISIDNLIDRLIKMGYSKDMLVNKTGEFASRGFIVDIYPINCDNPVRVEFFGDSIESIRIFDVNNQKSIANIDTITIYPVTDEVDNVKKDSDYTYLYDFVSADIVFFDNYDDMLKESRRIEKEVSTINLENKIYSIDLIKPKKVIKFSSFDNCLTANEKSKRFDIINIEEKFSGVDDINNKLNGYIKNGYAVVLAVFNKKMVNKIAEELKNRDIVITNENDIYLDKINIINKKIYDSFLIGNLAIISERKLFNSQNEERLYKSKFRYGTRIKDVNKLDIGDYVVHASYGVGIYLGLTTLNKNNLKKDYLQIEYRGGDKLYIPVEKIDLISKYSSSEGSVPKINKLGGIEWQKTKLRVRKKIENIAKDLLKLYALRENIKGFSFEKDNQEQMDFEKAFQHDETVDQLKVVEEIKKDMESPHPMDRLLCGDVGYGKTEVAFRAAFKAVLSGKQVAMLCPTTILSNQHYLNALERFKEFPVNIALLNRFVSPKKAGEIKEKLKNGKIDIIFGTHRILSNDVKFKDLGLLIIDEEQRFGVKHKEKIKQFKNDIDVLTLSATPIPRTLQMSMSGVKSLSLIETPPLDRYPVQTYVLSEENEIIKYAIYKELARNGQIFILYNNIQNMEEKMSLIKTLVPEAKVVMAHGKINKSELENIMLDFTDKKYDVMLCTTIIETGIDIPNVNTLIVVDADRLGLSQLYQLRGRVGRSNKIAYCYLLYNKNKTLTDVAEKRLKVIKEFTELGSGFSIAMRDLSIRGAGAILGSEQAGFVDSVGIDLFLKLLEEEIKHLKGQSLKEDSEATMPLVDVETSIDNKYASEEELKIYIHQKINEIDSIEKLNEVKSELSDRFGKLDDSVIIYMHEELFEKMAEKLEIKDIRQTKNFIEILLPSILVDKIKIESLFAEVMNLSRMFRFGTRGKRITITLDIIKLDKHFIYYLIDLMKIIENNIK